MGLKRCLRAKGVLQSVLGSAVINLSTDFVFLPSQCEFFLSVSPASISTAGPMVRLEPMNFPNWNSYAIKPPSNPSAIWSSVRICTACKFSSVGRGGVQPEAISHTRYSLSEKRSSRFRTTSSEMPLVSLRVKNKNLGAVVLKPSSAHL